MQINAKTIDDLYPQLLEVLLSEGREVSPRGHLTLELHPQVIVLESPRSRLLLNPLRKINPGFLCAELLWIISGSNDSWIYKFNSKLIEFTNDGVLKGAYGPRIRNWNSKIDQLESVMRLLQRDPQSRQASIVIFDPVEDFKPHKDIPCTNLFRFLIRDNKLDMISVMRSQDVWLGLPYDIFTFTAIQELLAGFLQVELGKYYHFVDSLHIYERDIEKAKAVLASKYMVDVVQPMSPLHLSWEQFDKTMGFLISNSVVGQNEEEIMKIPSLFWRSIGLSLMAYQSKRKRNSDDFSALLGKIEDETIAKSFEQWYA